MWPLGSGFLHLVSCPQGSLMLWPVSELHSLLWLNHIPLCGHTFYSSFVDFALKPVLCSHYGLLR